MIKALTTISVLMLSLSALAQQAEEEDKINFGEQIFLPSIEIGYLSNSANSLSGGVITKTSIEYRVRNNNDVFFRINYDNYNADYTLNPENNLTNVITGTAAFTDLLFGAGYRFGDNQFRFFTMLQSGLKYYNFPEFVQNNTTINIEQRKRNIFSTRITLGLEYYLNEKSAVSFDLLQSQVWKRRDFWSNSGSAIGFSIGFITALY